MTQNLPIGDETRRVDDELLIDEDEILTEPNDDETIEDAEKAEQAIEQMQAHERRRDGTYDTGGDDLSPGIDSDIGANGPKEMDKD
jgi:hypothetical protein